MTIDPFKLPVPCRSGRFCETCRDRIAGAEFRAIHRVQYPEMYGPDLSCNFGLEWGHKGLAPWSAAFAQAVRDQLHDAAADTIAHQTALGPGDVVKLALAKLGYKLTPKCGCEEFRVQMNQWGWFGCVRRRKEIVAWFADKAREQNIQVDDERMWTLIRAGMKDLLRRRRT